MSTLTASTGRRDILGFFAFVALCFTVAILAGVATSTSVDGWYTTLTKPSFNPPSWLFGPVWFALYSMMAIAAWGVWRHADSAARTLALRCFGIQLALNLLWSVVFFGLRAPGAALVEILVLLGTIVLTIRTFSRVDRVAAWLLLPYAGWVAFAAVLNASIWWLNRV